MTKTKTTFVGVSKVAGSPPRLSKVPLANCAACPCFESILVDPPIKTGKKILLVGEAPGEVEEQRGEFFVGPTGDLLNERILPFSGVRRAELAITNALLCRPSRKLSPLEWKTAIACCAPRLNLDLRRTNPRLVIAAGKRALQALTGRAQITAWTGAPIQGWRFAAKEKEDGSIDIKEPGRADKVTADFTKYTILPVMHPAWHFRGSNINYLPMSRIHFERAKWLAEGRLEKWTWPEIVIEPGRPALHLLNLLRKAGRGGGRISYDVESIGDNPFSAPLSCVGVGHREIGAVSLPWESYNAGKFGWVQGVASAKTGIEKKCRDALLAILADPKIAKVAQNGQYDRMCLRKRGIAVKGEFYDTMIAHSVYASGIKHNLSLICSIEFHMPRWKEEFKVSSGKDSA